MSFFYDLNKKLDSIRATPALTHQQLNERDLGKHNNATTGFAALAKKTGGGEKGARIAGAQLAKMRAKGQVEEGSPYTDYTPVDEPVNKNAKAEAPGSRIKVDPPAPPASAASRAAPPTKKTANEAAKWRAPKHKGKLYTQEPGDSDDYDDMDYGYDDYGIKKRPANDPGQKRRMGGVGDEFSRTDPLEKGFGRSGTGSPVEKGPRKGLPKRDQITSLKGSIKDAHGTHTQPNLPEDGVPMTSKQKSFAKLAPPADKITFADKIAGAKKEVDEMLGNVAADAMKKAIGGGRGRNAEMDESGGHIDWSDDDRGRKLSSTGGRIDTSTPGVTRHTPMKGNYSGAGHDAHAGSDGPSGAVGRRRVGAGQGTKIGAKINTGKSKLMTREGDQDPADQGEYDQEGAMGRNEIHTMMRNAKQLEQMLGDNDNLPEWVQKKLSLASDYMQTIADYLASEKETDAEDQSGEEGMELAEKKSVRTKPKQSSGNDGNLANNAKPYDKVTQGDVVAGRLGKDEMGGKKKSTKPSAKKEEEVEESTTAGSVATAPASGKAGKGSMSFGKGIYDSIDRAVERQINESMNISMSMNNEGSGAGQTLTITATDEDASQLAQMLKMAGLGGGAGMSHGEDDLADQIRQAEQGHGGAAFGGEEVCSGCGMSNCGCDEMVDETYGDNVVDMNSPNYPTNTERAQDNFGYSGGLNKPKHDVAGNGQSTVPVTAVRGQDDDFQESIQRMREIAGIKEAGIIADPKDIIRQKFPQSPNLADAMPASDLRTSANRTGSYNNTFLDPAQKAQQRLSKQNESIFTDTANLWKSYKG